jgi:hypothetical protein
VRVRGNGAVLAAASVAVFVSLFLHWFQTGSHVLVLFGALDKLPSARTGWQLFSVLDLVLALVAGGGLAVAALMPRLGRRVVLGSALVVAAALVWAVLEVADPPAVPFNRGGADLVPAVGAYLAIGGLVAMLAALLLAATARRAQR